MLINIKYLLYLLRWLSDKKKQKLHLKNDILYIESKKATVE